MRNRSKCQNVVQCRYGGSMWRYADPICRLIEARVLKCANTSSSRGCLLLTPHSNFLALESNSSSRDYVSRNIIFFSHQPPHQRLPMNASVFLSTLCLPSLSSTSSARSHIGVTLPLSPLPPLYRPSLLHFPAASCLRIHRRPACLRRIPSHRRLNLPYVKSSLMLCPATFTAQPVVQRRPAPTTLTCRLRFLVVSTAITGR